MEKEGNIYALVADYGEGLKIINVTDPTNPALVSNFITKNAREVSTMIIGEKIYAFVVDAGFKIIEVTDPLNSVLVLTSSLDTNIKEIQLRMMIIE